jgi:N6-adenosine-specific RNA methylase IME4
VVDDLSALIRDIGEGRRQKFRGILADPPWQMSWDSTGRRGAAGTYYKLMTLDELCGLPLAEVADPRAFLFLWTPNVHVANGLALLQAWGFVFVEIITWDKLHGFGKGFYVRVASEQLLIGRMPDSPRRFDDNSISSMLRVQRRGHSEKPDEVHDIVQRATAGPYLELFARKPVPGWTCFGDQLAPASPAPQLGVAD